MKILRYWARGSATVKGDRTWTAKCFAGSNDSLEEALRIANERASATAAAMARGIKPDAYSYGERAVREEIIGEWYDGDSRTAVVTRNGYGALVLNTAQALFADLDYDTPSAKSARSSAADVVRSLLGKWLEEASEHPAGKLVNTLLGASKRKNTATTDQRILDKIDAIATSEPNLGMRVYRTANGFRCLVTTALYDPVAPSTIELLQRMGSDPQYVTLCRAQQCFRARLTPKPWRAGLPNPPARFPWASPKAEAAFRKWQARYTAKAQRRSVCALIGTFGSTTIHPTIAPIIDIHDRTACSEGLPLA